MRFSIITISLNAQDLIAETVNSVLKQTFTDFEIIVKDGRSKDATIANIPSDERIRTVVKNDRGIYDAMNQGIEEAKGEYLLFLNCGDTLYDDRVLEKVNAALVDAEPCILYGKRYTDGLGVVEYPRKLTKRYFYYSTICHQASFIHRSVFDKIGVYDGQLKIASDWKLFLDAKINNITYRYCDEILCTFLSGGVSETEKGKAISDKERELVIRSRYSAMERLLIPLLKTKAAQFLISVKHKILR